MGTAASNNGVGKRVFFALLFHVQSRELQFFECMKPTARDAGELRSSERLAHSRLQFSTLPDPSDAFRARIRISPSGSGKMNSWALRFSGRPFFPAGS